MLYSLHQVTCFLCHNLLCQKKNFSLFHQEGKKIPHAWLVAPVLVLLCHYNLCPFDIACQCMNALITNE